MAQTPEPTLSDRLFLADAEVQQAGLYLAAIVREYMQGRVRPGSVMDALERWDNSCLRQRALLSPVEEQSGKLGAMQRSEDDGGTGDASCRPA